MVSQFVDISDFQPDIGWADYKKWAEQGDGMSTVAIKSTEGVGFTASSFHAHRTGALAVGIDRLIIYHFARPDLNNSPIAEANWQFQVVGECRPQDILILDLEVEDSRATAEWAYEWLVQQERNYGGKLPGIYASDGYIRARLGDPRLARYPLWLANWQFDPNERPASPWPWSTYAYLQYTDRATNIPGIPGTVDADIFLGGTPMIDLSMPEIAFYFEQAPGNAWRCKQTGKIIGNAILDAYRDYGNNRLKGLYYLGLPLSNEYPAGTTKGNTQQDFELGRLGYDTDGSLGGRPGQAKGVYPLHVLPQPDQTPIDNAAQLLHAATQSIQNALTALGK